MYRDDRLRLTSTHCSENEGSQHTADASRHPIARHWGTRSVTMKSFDANIIYMKHTHLERPAGSNALSVCIITFILFILE